MSAVGARLGLRLTSENNICNMLSLFIRRSSSCTNTSTIPESKKNTLYLCFTQDHNLHDNDVFSKPKDWNNDVRSVRIDSYDDDDKELKEEHCMDNAIDDCPDHEYDEEPCNYYFIRYSGCSRFGSRILFHSETPEDYINWETPEDYINWVDVSTRPLKFQTYDLFPLYTKHSCIDGIWRQIDPKAFGSRVYLAMRVPPVFEYKYHRYYRTLYLNRSKKILTWNDKTRGVYVFDVAAPEKGWEEASHPTLRHVIPFLLRHRCPHFIIEDHNNPRLGNFNLIISIDFPKYRTGGIMYPYLLSENCETFQPVNNPIHLPDKIYFDRKIDFCNLGDQKFCLVMFEYSIKSVLVLTFEYEAIVDSNNNLEIQFRYLGTSRFQHPCASSKSPSFLAAYSHFSLVNSGST